MRWPRPRCLLLAGLESLFSLLSRACCQPRDDWRSSKSRDRDDDDDDDDAEVEDEEADEVGLDIGAAAAAAAAASSSGARNMLDDVDICPAATCAGNDPTSSSSPDELEQDEDGRDVCRR